MRLLAVLVPLFLAIATAQAQPYGPHDPMQILLTKETATGKTHALDTQYLERILDDLSAHALNYPPRFDTPEDRKRAERDVKLLAKMLGFLTEKPNPHPEILLRAALVNSIGHNLDIPGSAEKAASLYRKLLATAPSHPRGNYLYGLFLDGAAKPAESLPYLEKALAAGVNDAAYTLGLAHLSLGNKAKAIAYLEEYQRRVPGNPNTAQFIDAVRNGRFEIKTVKQ
jgi:tetratricopeptide (TPR) repeat protein